MRRDQRILATRSKITLSVGALLLSAAAASAADLSVSKAWVTPDEKVGSGVVVSMIVKNDGAEADVLLRARCPFANFSEKHTVDLGEGAPAMRSIPNIPVPAHSTLQMSSSGYHLMMLQTTEKLAVGAKFTCSVSFRKAGSMDVEVQVARAAPGL